MVSNVTHHQPVFDELMQEGRQLNDMPAIVNEVSGVEQRWNVVVTELERRTCVLETSTHLWTQYTQSVSHLCEHLSDISAKLQSNIRPNIHSANLASLANILKMNQVTYLPFSVYFALFVAHDVTCVAVWCM